MAPNELQTFLEMWQGEAQKTVALLRALPAGQYDFRPDPGGRSLGELAWHLAEADGYVTYGIEQGTFAPGSKPPGIERSEEHTSELQSLAYLVCRLLLEKKKKKKQAL